jgi:hypothetical protein
MPKPYKPTQIEDLLDASAWLQALAPHAGKMVREGDLQALAARLKLRADKQLGAKLKRERSR